MHRLVLLLLLLCTPALAAPFQETQSLNRGAPAGNPTDKTAFPVTPMPLSGVTRFRLTVCPPSGQSFSGGSVRLYVYNQVLGRWSFDIDQDFYVTAGTPAGTCLNKAFLTDVRVGFLYPAAQGFTVTGGSTIIIRVEPDTYGL